MEVDIIPAGEPNKYLVYDRRAAEAGYTKDKPLFGPAYDDECWNWCDVNHHEYRKRQMTTLINPTYIHDVEKACNKIVAAIEERGFHIVSDVTYRASAAWKDNPVHYAYVGDFGTTAKLIDKATGQLVNYCSTDDKVQFSIRQLYELIGYAMCLWELGLQLTFHKDGVHTVFNGMPEWITINEVD